jgi:WXG100 family type VII secretion target
MAGFSLSPESLERTAKSFNDGAIRYKSLNTRLDNFKQRVDTDWIDEAKTEFDNIYNKHHNTIAGASDFMDSIAAQVRAAVEDYLQKAREAKAMLR